MYPMVSSAATRTISVLFGAVTLATRTEISSGHWLFGNSATAMYAIMKKLRDIGKYIAYCNGGPVKATISKIFCLPYLPAQEIGENFEFIKNNCTDATLDPLFDYISRNWIHGRCWNPESWSGFGMAIRTNNDAGASIIGGWGPGKQSNWLSTGCLNWSLKKPACCPCKLSLFPTTAHTAPLAVTTITFFHTTFHFYGSLLVPESEMVTVNKWHCKPRLPS